MIQNGSTPNYYAQNGTNGHSSHDAGGGRQSRLLGPDGLPFRVDSPEAGFAVPHVIQFASVVSSGFRSYYHAAFDEALKHSREDALAMRNDAFLAALLQERQLGTVSLKWRIEVDDERDPLQKSIQDGLTRIIRRIPYFRKMCEYLLEAIWYGREAAQVKWGWQQLRVPSLSDPRRDELRRCLVVKKHQPINGDKIGHHWDGTPYITINSAYANTVANAAKADINPTTQGGMGLYLRGSWRWRYIVHTHKAVDADFFDSSSADAVHGVGIRSVLFWLDWLRKEWLSNVADWCERTGLGIRLWYYQGNNPNSKAAVEKAARESNDRTNLFIPRYQIGANASEGVEFVDTSSTGADLLLRLQEHIEEIQERYVIGQSLSGGQGSGDSLGGEGKSKLARDTKNQIIAYDAGNLGETLSTDLVKVIQHFTYREQEAREVNARLVFAVDEPEPEKFLNAVRTFVELSGKVRMSDVQGVLGLSAPQEGDEVISLETINKAKQAGMPQPPAGGQPGMGGAGPGGEPGGGGGDPGAGAGDDPLAALLGGGGAGAGGKGEDLQDTPGDDDAGDAGDDDQPAPGADDIQRKAGAAKPATTPREPPDLDAGIEDIIAKRRFARRGGEVSALSRAIDAAAAEADPAPSDAQKASGNYRMGHVTVQGLPITIENAAGSTRSGVSKGGVAWSVKMKNHYGYIKKTESEADADHLDAFLGPDPESEIVFVIDQVRPNEGREPKFTRFDEHKCMIGWTNAADAKAAYLANYSAGWTGFAAITPMTMDGFKAWIESGDTGRPVATGAGGRVGGG